MSRRPPKDRPLTPAIVRAVVDAQFPAVAGGEPRFVGAGWDNEVYAVGAYYFRFPQREEVVVWHERECVVTALAREAIGEVVPHFELLGEPSDAFPYPFVGYRPRPGVAADAGPPPTPGLAAALGAALGRLHAVDPLRVPRTPDSWEDQDWDDWREELVGDREAVLALVPAALREAAAPYLDGSIPPPPGPSAPRFTYNDIGPEHILVDPETGALTGLIDFDDAMVADPAVDFVGVVGFAGYAFCDAMLAHYPLPIEPTFRDRIRWAARTLNLVWLVGDDTMAPETLAKHQRWLHRAFAPT